MILMSRRVLSAVISVISAGSMGERLRILVGATRQVHTSRGGAAMRRRFVVIPRVVGSLRARETGGARPGARGISTRREQALPEQPRARVSAARAPTRP